MKNYKTNGGYITFETADTAPKAISGKNKPNRGDDGNYKNSPEAQDKQNRIRNARKQGKTYREIAKIEDVSFQYAQMVCTNNHVARPRKPYYEAMGISLQDGHTSQGEIIEDLIEEYLPV